MGAAERNTGCTYETIIPKRIPFWLFWPLIGVIGFVGYEILLHVYGENSFLVLRLLFAIATASFPMAFIWSAKLFRETMQGISPLYWKDLAEFQRWLTAKENHLFTLESKTAKLLTAGIVVASLITLLTLGLPLRNAIPNALTLVGYVFIITVFAQGSYIALSLLLTLSELTQYKMHVPFFGLPHPAIGKLYGYYMLAATATTLGYVFLVISAWQSPYGLVGITLIWLSALSIYPIAMFFWSTYQIHKLVQIVKQAHVETANQQVQVALQNVIETQSLAAYKRLDKAMEIQTKVQSIQEWPIALSGMITFLIAAATAVAQIVISVVRLIKP